MTAEVNTKIKRVFLFLLGIIITFSIIGVITGITGKLLTNFLGPWLYLFAGIITLISGLNLLDIIKINIPSLFSSHKTTNPFILGLIYGGVVLGCVGPLIAAVLAFIVAKATILYGFLMMLFFGLGFSTPFLLFGFLITDKEIQKKILKHTLLIRKIGGISLILVSLYLFFIASWGLL